VDLWKYYLGYIRKRFSGDSSAESTQVVLKAFEAVMQNVGIDKDSGPLWSDYISFLKSIEPTTPHEEQQKLDQIRKAFQRAIMIPTNNVEQVWKDYDQWEMGLNRLTAKKYIADKSGVYMMARSNVRELRNLLDPLDIVQKQWLAKPPSWTEEEISVVRIYTTANRVAGNVEKVHCVGTVKSSQIGRAQPRCRQSCLFIQAGIAHAQILSSNVVRSKQLLE